MVVGSGGIVVTVVRAEVIHPKTKISKSGDDDEDENNIYGNAVATTVPVGSSPMRWRHRPWGYINHGFIIQDDDDEAGTRGGHGDGRSYHRTAPAAFSAKAAKMIREEGEDNEKDDSGLVPPRCSSRSKA